MKSSFYLLVVTGLVTGSFFEKVRSLNDELRNYNSKLNEHGQAQDNSIRYKPDNSNKENAEQGNSIKNDQEKSKNNYDSSRAKDEQDVFRSNSQGGPNKSKQSYDSFKNKDDLGNKVKDYFNGFGKPANIRGYYDSNVKRPKNSNYDFKELEDYDSKCLSNNDAYSHHGINHRSNCKPSDKNQNKRSYRTHRNSKCSEGRMCFDPRARGFYTCNFNQYIFRPCGPNTQCQALSGRHIICNHDTSGSNYAPEDYNNEYD